MIALENVVKSYPNGVGAINGISLHIKRGEFVLILTFGVLILTFAL